MCQENRCEWSADVLLFDDDHADELDSVAAVTLQDWNDPLHLGITRT